MTAIKQAYINALLADAAYVNLIKTPLNDPANLVPLSADMTPTLAAYIAANFEVASIKNTSDILTFCHHPNRQRLTLHCNGRASLAVEFFR